MTRRKPADRDRAAVISSVIEHFNERYGRNDSKLDMWQRLCGDMSVEQGGSITRCKKNLRGKFVSIIDFVQLGPTAPIFHSARDLSQHIRKTPSKSFPVQRAKQNPILKWILVKVV